MKPLVSLFLFHFMQIWRSRLLVLWLLFSFFVQYGSVKLLQSASVQYQNMQAIIGVREIIFSLIYVQFFTGGVLATVYGIWTLPYLHESSRAQLTFSLPISKWLFPVCYFISFKILLGLQGLAMFLSLAGHFGLSVFRDPVFPWMELLSGSITAVVGLEVTAFSLAVIALLFGKVSAFMGGTTAILVLQVSGAVFRTGIGEGSLWRTVYKFMPPFGEVFFDLKEGLAWQGVQAQHLLLSIAWLLVFAALFRMKLSRPVG